MDFERLRQLRDEHRAQSTSQAGHTLLITTGYAVLFAWVLGTGLLPQLISAVGSRASCEVLTVLDGDAHRCTRHDVATALEIS